MYDLANKVKTEIIERGSNGIAGALTKTTFDSITGLYSAGLYLDNFMAGTANTALAVDDNGNWFPDPAAAGTAMASGKKTSKHRVSSDIEMKPISNILEICELAGKATGMVTTGSWIDAAPSGFLSHANKRASQTIFYQREISYQILNSGIDVLLASGTDNGAFTKNNGFLHSLHASDLGYQIVNNLAGLQNAITSGATKIWSNFLEGNNGNNQGYDDCYNHIKFDIEANEGDLSLLYMTKAALATLSENINDEDGFFLTIEGGALDVAIDGMCVSEAVGEYLAFDETFAYCVNWAMERDDTIIVAFPNRDSGGFEIGGNIPVTSATSAFDTDGNRVLDRSECLEYVADCIIDGREIITDAGMNPYIYKSNSSENATDIPLWLYAPDWCRNNLLEAIGLPYGDQTASATTVRTGSFNDGTVINPLYNINNSDITGGVLELCGLMSAQNADKILFADAAPYISSFNWSQCTVKLNKGEVIPLGSRFWFESTSEYSSGLLENGRDFSEGRCVYMFDCLDDLSGYEVNYKNGTVYLPKSFLIERGYIIG